MTDDLFALDDFAGTARLFPLPNLVLFPHVVQPLHIFEPRYRQMTADALAGDRLIAMALLAPGWENTYGGEPPLYPVACLGKLVADQKLPDGRYNLLLRGLQRVRIVEELDAGTQYRVARVEVIADPPPPPLAASRQLRTDLADTVLPLFADNAPARERLAELFEGELPLGTLCDVLAFALPIPLTARQALLEEADVAERAGRLLTELRCVRPLIPGAAPAGERKFPPDFSAN